MQSSTQEQLSSTFLEVVEQLTFMFGEVTPKDELEAEGTEFMRRDALAEMLNVVCGHVMMALAGSDANFKLDAPRTGSVQEDEFNRIMLSEDFIGFMLDDSPVFLGLSLEK